MQLKTFDIENLNSPLRIQLEMVIFPNSRISLAIGVKWNRSVLAFLRSITKVITSWKWKGGRPQHYMLIMFTAKTIPCFHSHSNRDNQNNNRTIWQPDFEKCRLLYVSYVSPHITMITMRLLMTKLCIMVRWGLPLKPNFRGWFHDVPESDSLL